MDKYCLWASSEIWMRRMVRSAVLFKIRPVLFHTQEVFMSPQEVLEFAKSNQVKQLDLRFSDIPGLQHHVSYPITELSVGSFQDGFGMDGSSIRGWAAINES